eukprot:934495-Amphidinium_carterae.1
MGCLFAKRGLRIKGVCPYKRSSFCQWATFGKCILIGRVVPLVTVGASCVRCQFLLPVYDCGCLCLDSVEHVHPMYTFESQTGNNGLNDEVTTTKD